MNEQFNSPEFIKEHIQTIMQFYAQHAIDNTGGYFQSINAKGEISSPSLKHLMSSSGLTYLFASTALRFSNNNFLEYAQHGYDHVSHQHFDILRNAYHWIVENNKPLEQENYCAGLAVLLLMFAAAKKVGIEGATRGIEGTFQLLENRFWQKDQGLYVDHISPNWTTTSPYRGQQSNMFCVEALIAVFEATLDKRYLQRAILIAENICLSKTQQNDVLIWDHYHQDWSIDWHYNQNSSKNESKPWGYQSGHLLKWVKLLLMLNRHLSLDWLIPHAEKLFNATITRAWDDEYGGIFTSFAPDGSISDDRKNFWVHAEAIAASALLAKATDDQQYWEEYHRLWSYCWSAFCNKKHQPWRAQLNRSGQLIESNIAIPGKKIDHHSISACLEVLRVLET